ncbi:hypothetical protein C0995_007037 [Termitomyces sp. Mi166|nr:hypothetical protein C0995_007037 [Termitomyces sp. Mi166\
MRDSSERLEARFGAALDFNPTPFAIDPETPCPKLTHPLLFYDKHLDERLSLQRVVLIPSLSTYLREAVNGALNVIMENNVDMPSVDEWSFPTPDLYRRYSHHAPVKDALEIGQRYENHMGNFAGILASMLLLHPTASLWVSSVRLLRRMDTTRTQKYYAMNEDFRLFSPHSYNGDVTRTSILKEAWDALDNTKRDELQKLSYRFPVLAVWQMLFPSRGGEDVLKRMDEFLVSTEVPKLRCHSRWRGPADVDLPPSPDAINTAWGSPVLSFVEVVSKKLDVTPPMKSSLRRSARLSKQIFLKAKDTDKSSLRQWHQHWPSVTIPSQSKSVSNDELSMSILQHAWANAVETDSSFIILHCGTFERIAFRHRASQTLFLSELIDVMNCKDPQYGEIQLGLFLSIIKDALDRTLQLVDREERTKIPTTRKRKSKAVESLTPIKRRRTRAGFAQEAARKLTYQSNLKRVSDTSSNRQVLLLRIQHHHFNSPNPASFFRVDSRTPRKSTYKSSEYLCVTITSAIAGGATGDAHKATIELITSEGETLSFPDAIIKLSFGRVEGKRMRHEYDVYQHLSSSGVTGIPYVFGLFEDAESDALALLMTDVGTCLVGRTPYENDEFRPVTETEADAFMEVLKPIHAAGVRHRDLRVENLVLSEDGVPYIIDFDRAVLNASERSRNREFEHLRSLLDGYYTEVGVSFGTPHPYEGRSASGSTTSTVRN